MMAEAIGYIEEGAWTDPAYLESIRRYARPLSIADGAAAAISLKIITP